MPDKYLIHKPSGIVYVYQEVYAMRDDFEDYTPPSADPAPEPVAEIKPVPKPRRKAEPIDEVALSADASRNLP